MGSHGTAGARRHQESTVDPLSIPGIGGSGPGPVDWGRDENAGVTLPGSETILLGKVAPQLLADP
jgi:hypothetical protein